MSIYRSPSAEAALQRVNRGGITKAWAVSTAGFDPNTMVGHPSCPYEMGVRDTEVASGLPRSQWEHVMRTDPLHHWAEYCMKRAKIHAGIPENRLPEGMQGFRGPNARTTDKHSTMEVR